MRALLPPSNPHTPTQTLLPPPGPLRRTQALPPLALFGGRSPRQRRGRFFLPPALFGGRGPPQPLLVNAEASSSFAPLSRTPLRSQDQYWSPPNFKRILSAKLKALTASRKLIKGRLQDRRAGGKEEYIAFFYSLVSTDTQIFRKLDERDADLDHLCQRCGVIVP